MAKLLGERKEEPKESSVKHPWAKIGPPTRNHSARPSTDSKLPLRLRSTFAQEDMQTNVMQAPKLTVLNGQSSQFDVTDQQYYVTGLVPTQVGQQTVLVPENRPYNTGFRMTVQPTVSADRRYVRMNFNASL